MILNQIEFWSNIFWHKKVAILLGENDAFENIWVMEQLQQITMNLGSDLDGLLLELVT